VQPINYDKLLVPANAVVVGRVEWLMHDQPTAGAMPGGANRVLRLPVEVAQLGRCWSCWRRRRPPPNK
jgi:hypothetical protein